MNKHKLKIAMAIAQENQTSLAQKLSLSNSRVSYKVNNKAPWTLDEVRRVAEILSLSRESVHEIFFQKENNGDEGTIQGADRNTEEGVSTV